MFHFVFMIPLGGGSGGPISKKAGIAILISILVGTLAIIAGRMCM